MSQMLPEMFEALAQEAAPAIEDAAEADARFLEQTAANEDTALARIADNEKNLAGKADAIRARTSDDELVNALRDWQSERYQFGNGQYLLDKGDFGHILSRHFPGLWDGSTKAEQTFFGRGMSPQDVQDAIRGVLTQNRDTLISRGTNSIYQISGSYDGQSYVLGISNGHISQFYPLPRS